MPKRAMPEHARFEHIKADPKNKRLLLLDQRHLPLREEYFICRTVDELVFAIREMVVRGAPAIGVSAAWGCWLAALEMEHDDLGRSPHWRKLLDEALDRIAAARPTAVNLAWAVDRMRSIWKRHGDWGLIDTIEAWGKEAAAMQAADAAMNRKIGEYGAALIDEGDTILTHCNAGALATAGYGTALGVIYAAHFTCKNIRVIADETRPLLQGARLTAYELMKNGVPVTLACDNSCALIMSRGLVQKVVVGADRIAANGDTANKIGTYGVAILAREFGVPFYVAAPGSTFDFSCPDGAHIPIEERPGAEVTHFAGTQIAPEGVPACNFAFDVTPAELISGIITEHGVFKAPYGKSLAKLKKLLK